MNANELSNLRIGDVVVVTKEPRRSDAGNYGYIPEIGTQGLVLEIEPQRHRLELKIQWDVPPPNEINYGDGEEVCFLASIEYVEIAKRETLIYEADISYEAFFE